MDITLPPRSLDAEQAILCALLQDAEMVQHAIGLLQPEHFYSTAHRLIYQACVECFSQQIPISVSALIQQLGPELQTAGGKVYLMDLLLGANQNAHIINTYSLKYWAKVVIDHAMRREVIEVCSEIQESAYDLSQNGYLDEAQNLLFFVSEAYKVEEEAKISPVDEAIEQLEKRLSSSSRITGLPTGYSVLDFKTGGLQPYQLVTIAARPGNGKSTAGLTIANHVAQFERKPILYFSLEMGAAELMERVIKTVADSGENLERLKAAAELIQGYKHRLIIDDTAGLTISAIQSKIFKVKKTNPELALIVVDHIGLIASEGKKNQNRAYELQEITTRLKVIAKTIQVPIIQMAQMNRAIEARQDKKPMLSDLRDSGSIEMDSDVVLFTTIDRDENRVPTGQALFTIAKQRNGELAEIPMVFIPHIPTFRERRYP